MKTHETQDNGGIKFPRDSERDEIWSKYQQIYLREKKRNIHLDNGNKQKYLQTQFGGKAPHITTVVNTKWKLFRIHHGFFFYAKYMT